jgi:ATP-dependent helicase HrpA
MRNWLKKIRRANDEAEFAKWLESANKSLELRKKRVDAVPQINFDQTLPIYQRREEIGQAIRDNQVVVISGETGSGKSTQLPLIALELGFGVSGLIGHTQPRRIAARGVASRIASELKTKIGTAVGYKMRFADETKSETLIKLMTDGILLAETQSDRFLSDYDLIIVDEAHERSLNIDFLLGYLKRILAKRKDLRLVITSATIDTERFAEHFTSDPEKPTPIINVEGRTFPVEIVYKEVGSEVDQRDPHDQVVQACLELATIDSGDMLVFLPTEKDIRTVAKKLRAAHFTGDAGSRQTEILPLYARLTTEQQNQIFQSHQGRRIVLATNVAESSITVPGIKYVVDTGTARISRYAPRSKVQRLPIEAVSQASANQRAGRCGRVEPGICVRLYGQEDFESRAEFTTPEIRRTNLASVILQTLSLHLGDIEEFPFIDPPRPEMVRDGYKTLFEIGAIDHSQKLTKLGRRLGRMPVDPRIGKIIFEGHENGCLADVLIIAAALEIQDPRQRPLEKQQAADTAHEQFRHPQSDFLSLLKLWDFFQEQKENLSNSKLRKCCVTNFLSFNLMQQWRDIHRQLIRMAREAKLKAGDRRDDYDAIHQSLLSGFLSGVAMLEDRHEYTGAGGVKFNLWPGSGVFASKPKWAMVGEIVETTKRYGRTVARISPEWIEPLAEHLIKRRHVDPHYSSKKQTAMAYENVTLFGLPIVTRRRVGFSSINPEESRRLFIDHGLVEGQLRANHSFYNANQHLRKSIQDIADKTRDRTMVVDDYRVSQFYDEHLPLDAVDHASLTKLLKDNADLNKKLKMQQSDLLPEVGGDDVNQQFPDQVLVGSIEVPVEYRFAPGESDDGPTIQIPVEGVGQVDDLQTGWLVPGLIPSRIEAMIRSLPKSVRRTLIPAPETAKKVASLLEFGKGSFVDAVSRELTKLAAEPVMPEMFNTEKVQSHLLVNMKVVDAEGEVIAEGRSVAELKDQLGSEHLTNEVTVEDDSTWHQDGLKDWTWGEMPERVEIQRGRTTVPVFVSLVDQGDCVGLRMLDSKSACDQSTSEGLIRLLALKHRKHLKSQVNWLPQFDQMAVLINRVIHPKDLKKGLGDMLIRVGLVEGKKAPRNRSEYDQLCQNAVQQIGVATQDVAKWFPKMCQSAQQVFIAMEGFPNKFFKSKTDIQRQLKALMHREFLTTPWAWLKHYPRYLNGITNRIDKVASNSKEDASIAEIDRLWEQYESLKERHRQHSVTDPEIDRFRWMIEEYRISLFSQQLGTSIPVSAKRLEKQWAKVQKV